ncbi:putative T7SS-secreted protein [Streptomyces sp. NPDC058698]|uniref:putative T7SS-secreted protein n=2 Tax=unclassified Streptomyces TaxID=2593676 RepID=UPI0036683217
MSRTDADWPPLWHDDPTPGDPEEVAELGRKLRKMADMIDEQSRVIAALASVDGWDSEAGKRFHEIADGTADRLKKSFKRYDEAAKAIGEEVREGGSGQFASEMRRAQRKADKALADYREAKADHDLADGEVKKFTDKYPMVHDIPAAEKGEYERWVKKRDEALHRIGGARKAVKDARDIYDDAGDKAARHIKNVVHHDAVRDPGGILNWIADHADWLSTAATVLAVVALVAAVVLSGGVVAAILVGLAAAASATALTGRLYDAFARGGKLDLLKIGLDILGIIPGLGALKGLTAAAKGARLLAAREAVWAGFTNGFAVKNFNKGVVWASKYLTSKGITRVKLPANGFDPELVTRYIKGASLANAGVQGLLRVKNRMDGIDDSPAESSTPTVVPRPTPTPGVAPGPSGRPTAPTPSPQPAPSPSSTAFHSALAPAA